MCGAHYQWWRRNKTDTQRCDYQGCTNHLADRHGRRGYHTKYRRLCREHEYLHLTEHRNPEQSEVVEQENRRRLAAGITVRGTCWVYTGPAGTNPSGYPQMYTYLSADVTWSAHRVAWGLLMGGHRQREQLDHLAGCEVGPGCASPCHLQPVSRAENGRRRAARNAWRRGECELTVKGTGPWFNAEAINSPKVRQFAREYGLPIPVMPENPSGHAGPRRRASRKGAQNAA